MGKHGEGSLPLAGGQPREEPADERFDVDVCAGPSARAGWVSETPCVKCGGR